MSIEPSFITSHVLCDQSFEQLTCDVWPLVAARLRKRLWVPMVLDSLRFGLFVGLRTRDRTIVLTVELQIWTFFAHMWRTSTRNWRPVDAFDKPVDTICSAWRVTGCNQRVPWHRGYDSLSILLRCQCRSLWGGHNILETLSGSKRWQKQ